MVVCSHLCFNPRTHVGCDQAQYPICMVEGEFQSTHPRRVRHLIKAQRILDIKFQSTHPRRVRLWVSFLATLIIQFQSTHPRRVRLGCFRQSHALLLFQSTHPRRVRLPQSPINLCLTSFNPRTHVGCDPTTPRTSLRP